MSKLFDEILKGFYLFNFILCFYICKVNEAVTVRAFALFILAACFYPTEAPINTVEQLRALPTMFISSHPMFFFSSCQLTSSRSAITDC